MPLPMQFLSDWLLSQLENDILMDNVSRLELENKNA